MIYINPYLSVPINTIIGGVASAISTKSALATKLAISESVIKRFEIVGSDIRAHISASYSIPIDCFRNDSTLTKYLDLGGKCNGAGNDAFNNTGSNEFLFPVATTFGSACFISNNFLSEISLSATSVPTGIIANSTSLKFIYLLNLENIGTKSNAFYNLTACELIDMRKMKYYGSPSTGGSAANSGFANLKTGCEIRVNIFLKTADSGNVDRALNWVKTNRSAIVKFYDDNGDYVSTL